jgi:Flp pilus assembly protein TadD
VLFLVWTLNSFCSVWIQNSATQRIYAARRLLRDRQLDRAVDQADQAVRKDPSNPTAHCFLAAMLDETGRSSEALDHTKRGLELDNSNGHCQLQMAIDTAKQGDVAQAMNIAQRIVEAEPENSRAYDLWFSCARELRQTYNSIAIAKDALAASPFDADLHYRAGLAAGEIGDFPTAVPQFAYALLLQPSRSDAEQKLHLALLFAAKSANASDQFTAIASSAPDSAVLENELAWIFATAPESTVRNGSEAIRLAERACVLTNRGRPKFLATLAAAYGEAGRFSDAVAAAQESRSLARSTGDTSTSYLADRLLGSLQNQQPFREDLSP